MAALHINDILSSSFNKPKEEVSTKNITFQSGEPIKPLSIKVDKTVNGPDGSRTTFTVSMEQTFTTAQELKSILDAIGYCGKKGIVDRMKEMVRK